MTDRVFVLACCCVLFGTSHALLAALRHQLSPGGFVVVLSTEAVSRAVIILTVCNIFQPTLAQMDVYCPLIKGGVALRRKAQSTLRADSTVSEQHARPWVSRPQPGPPLRRQPRW